MTNKWKQLLAVAAILVTSAANSKSADRRNFWLLNNTGRKIDSVYIAAHSSGSSWGKDVLGDAAIPHGLGSVIYFLDNSNACLYDFRIEYGDGSHEDYVQGRNLGQFHAIQFNSGTNDAF